MTIPMMVMAILIALPFGPLTAPARAQGIITRCTEAELDNALRGGGLVQFVCSGVIVTRSTKRIEKDTVLDATGQHVTIAHQNNADVFQVLPGVNLETRNLIIGRLDDIRRLPLTGYPPGPPNEWLYILLGGLALVVVSLLAGLVAVPRITRRRTPRSKH